MAPPKTRSTDDDSNGRVEYGRLLERVDYTADAVDSLARKLESYIEEHLEWRRYVDSKLQSQDAEIGYIKKTVKRWGVVNVTGTASVILHAIAQILGIKI